MVRQTLFRHFFSAAVLFVCAAASLTAQQLAPAGGTVDRRHTVLPKLGSEGEALNKVSLANNEDPIIRERADEILTEEKVGILVYQKRNRSIVNVDTEMVRQGPYPFSEIHGEGRGSGIVLTKDGVILTNFHVVDGANSVTITLFNGEAYSAALIGKDPNTDIALLKINAPEEDLFPVEFGDSSQILIGQVVYAIGNPFGIDRTLTRGIVSNLNRTIDSPKQHRQIKGVVQIDAAINPGNSGGALFDSRGRMIGMNTAIASQVGQNSGVGFATPVNTIWRIANILLAEGKVNRGDIGIVQVTEVDGGLVPALIDNEGPADRAGLRGGKVALVVSNQHGMRVQSVQRIPPRGGVDVIIGVNGQPVRTGEEFISLVEEHMPGEKVVLNIIRDGKQRELPVVLGQPSDEEE
ncbi:MAG: trypsin-like peptidase domain-containing protein [Thermoguttaceae bacterium]|nr:trypsin-like peptidase domain-containing protein [Thermoguttaceae bacterium]